MKYYVAYDDRGQRDKIIAFHEERDVVQEYIDSVVDVSYRLGRCKSSELKKIENVEELYLIRIGDTYIQTKFYDFMYGLSESDILELRSSVHTLEKILRIGEPGVSTRKGIIKTIAYLKRLILEEEGLVPDYDTLEREFKEYEREIEFRKMETILDLDPSDKFLS